MKNASRSVWLVGVVLAGTLSSEALGQFEDLIKHVPETANAMVLVNAKAVFASEIAVREGWQANREKNFAAGLTGIPPKAETLIIASDLDIEQRHANWEVAIAKLQAEVSASSLASQAGGVVDKIESVPVVRLPDNSFIMDFPGDLFGMMTPGNRQSVASWITRPSRSVSAYLQEGMDFAESGAGIIMVLDLQNAFSAKEIELGIERFKSVQNSKVDRAKLSQLLATLEGVMLGITFNDKPFGAIKFDFSQNPALLTDIAKPFILDILGEYGVMIDEFDDWNVAFKDNHVTLEGDLTDNGLTRLASFVQLPSHVLHTQVATQQQAAANTTGDPQQTVLQTTQQYYESVQRLLSNLRSRKSDMRTMGQLAQWFENYGRHVDQLPTLNVDKEMLQYGNYISSQLHGASMTLKGTTIQRRLSEMGASSSAKIYGGALGNVSQNNWQQSSYGMYGGSFGGNYGRRMETNAAYGLAARGGVEGAMKSELRNQQQAITQVHAQAKASAATSVQQIVQNIETASTQIRQAMTDKYKVQF